MPRIKIVTSRSLVEASIATAATTGVPINGAVGPRQVRLGTATRVISNRPEGAGVGIRVVLLPQGDGDVVVGSGDIQRIVGPGRLVQQVALVGDRHVEALAATGASAAGSRQNSTFVDLTGVSADNRFD